MTAFRRLWRQTFATQNSSSQVSAVGRGRSRVTGHRPCDL